MRVPRTKERAGQGAPFSPEPSLCKTLISKLPASSRDYLEAFGVRAVCVSPTGKVSHTDDPEGASLAWWCPEKDARRAAAEARHNGDIEEAARRLGVRLTEHTRAAERAAEKTAKLEAALREANANGLLQWFNAEFRRRRLAATKDGRKFMPYTVAQRRLRTAMAGIIAAGGQVERSALAVVFEAADGRGAKRPTILIDKAGADVAKK